VVTCADPGIEQKADAIRYESLIPARKALLGALYPSEVKVGIIESFESILHQRKSVFFPFLGKKPEGVDGLIDCDSITMCAH